MIDDSFALGNLNAAENTAGPPDWLKDQVTTYRNAGESAMEARSVSKDRGKAKRVWRSG